MTKWTVVATFLAVGMLAGCAVPSPSERRKLDAMIGQPELNLLRTYGVPSESYTANGHTFLAYTQDNSFVSPTGPGAGWGWGWGGPGWGYGGWRGGYSYSYNSELCQTVFELTDGRVGAWTLHGDGC